MDVCQLSESKHGRHLCQGHSRAAWPSCGRYQVTGMSYRGRKHLCNLSISYPYYDQLIPYFLTSSDFTLYWSDLKLNHIVKPTYEFCVFGFKTRDFNFSQVLLTIFKFQFKYKYLGFAFFDFMYQKCIMLARKWISRWIK